jgi:hypothetical protein
VVAKTAVQVRILAVIAPGLMAAVSGCSSSHGAASAVSPQDRAKTWLADALERLAVAPAVHFDGPDDIGAMYNAAEAVASSGLRSAVDAQVNIDPNMDSDISCPVFENGGRNGDPCPAGSRHAATPPDCAPQCGNGAKLRLCLQRTRIS